MDEIKICPSCGKENKASAKFCGGCGTSLENVQVKSDATAPAEETVNTDSVVSATATTENNNVTTEETTENVSATPVVTPEPTPVTPEPVAVTPEPTPIANEQAVVTPEVAPAAPAPASAPAPAKKEKAPKAKKEKAPKQPKEKKKKGSAAPLIIVILILIIGGGALAYLYFFTGMFMSPKQKVMLAFAKAFGAESAVAEVSDNVKKAEGSNFCADSLVLSKDLIETCNLITTDPAVPYESDLSLKLQNFESDYVDEDEVEMFYGAGIDFYQQISYDERQNYNSLGILYNGDKVVNLEVYFDDSDCYIGEANFLDGSILFNTETLGDDLIEWDYFDELGLYEDDVDFLSFNVFDDFYSSYYESEDALLKDSEDYVKSVKALYDSINVESTGKYAKYEIGGKEVKCDSYTVTVPADGIEAFMEGIKPVIVEAFNEEFESFPEEIRSELESEEIYEYDGNYYSFDEFDDYLDDVFADLEDELEDVTFTVYIDGKCRLVGLKADGTIYGEDQDVDYEMEFSFTGEEYLCDEVEGYIYLENEDEDQIKIDITNTRTSKDKKQTNEFIVAVDTSDDESLTFTVTSTANDKGEFTALFEMDNCGDTVSLSVEGSTTVSDTSVEMIFDDITLTTVDDESVSLSGSYSVATIDEVDTIDGDTYEILTMDEDELMDLAMEIEEAFMDSDLYELVESVLGY